MITINHFYDGLLCVNTSCLRQLNKYNNDTLMRNYLYRFHIWHNHINVSNIVGKKNCNLVGLNFKETKTISN